MSKSKHRGFRRLVTAAGYSWAGLRAAWRHDAAFRQELIVGAILVPLAFRVGDSGLERLLLLGSWVLVLIVELLNSAIEAAIDRIGPEHHPLSGRAKDLGSAAVLAALLLAAMTWAVVALG